MVEVVKFQMPNCGPCRVVQILLDRLKTELPAVEFTSVDASQNLDQARELGISAAPTCLIKKDGVEVHRFVGAKARYEEYLQVLKPLLEAEHA
jgi:thiol-disulfide isomerase/thioredoxin